MEDASKPGKIKTVRPETLEFIILYNQLRGISFDNNSQLAEALGFNSASSITEIVKSRQNIDPEKLKVFKEIYAEFLNPVRNKENTEISETEKRLRKEEGIPMYE